MAQMAIQYLRESVRRPGLIMVLAFMLLLLATLQLISDAVRNTSELSAWFVPLLATVVVGLLILAIVTVSNLFKLFARYRRRTAGSRLTARLVLMFAFLSVIPLSLLYYFSMGFLLKGIDSWFDVKVDRSMENVLELSQAALTLNQRIWIRYTENLMTQLDDLSVTSLAVTLDALRDESGAIRLTVYHESGNQIVSSHRDPTELVSRPPEGELLKQVRVGAPYAGLIKQGGSLLVNVMVKDFDGRPLILQGLYPTSERIAQLTENVEQGFNSYKESAYLRHSLKFSFTLVLSLVLLFTLLGALLAAYHSARRLVAPIANIARGTRAVAEGDYDRQLPLPKHNDELRFLVGSFNEMTRRIALARDAAARSRLEVETQRAYLQSILAHLSSGVMTFDEGGRLIMANHACEHILGVDLALHLNKTMTELAEVDYCLRQFFESMGEHCQSRSEWRAEVDMLGRAGRQTLLCQRTLIKGSDEGPSESVLMVDDITLLIQAQREAAWGEVARRLAHEIKNPLTPIQLSAERLRHKYLTQLPEDQRGVLERATSTIVQQVEAMKEMVNAFSDYAKPPRMQAQPVQVDQLVQDLVELYRGNRDVQFHSDLQAPQAGVHADPNRLRQVFHNLLKNALEALAEQQRQDGLIELASELQFQGDSRFWVLIVQDNGPGIPQDVMLRLFEPYVTSKAKGTGLGMAIVKKIIEEHGGVIQAANRPQGGARITIRLPIYALESSPIEGTD
jgi:nitrogen fixation/metabolism regulation signal transduction histidine kinase